MSDPNRVLSRLGAGLAAIGLLSAMASAVAFVALDMAAGDVEAVEWSLTAASPSTGPALISTTTSEPATQTGAPDPGPILAVNEISRLDQLVADDRRVPVRLRIDALGVDAPVAAYGIDSRTGQMDVPGNVHDVGWYEYGPSPGEPGSAVLAAHVDLRSQGPGVFFDLKTLDPGRLILVTYDDGSDQWFEVKARTTYQKDELPLDVIFSREGASVLTLITCGGGFSASEASYDSNVVVYATPVEERMADLSLS